MGDLGREVLGAGKGEETVGCDILTPRDLRCQRGVDRHHLAGEPSDTVLHGIGRNLESAGHIADSCAASEHLKEEAIIDVSVGAVIEVKGPSTEAHSAGCAAIALTGPA